MSFSERIRRRWCWNALHDRRQARGDKVLQFGAEGRRNKIFFIHRRDRNNRKRIAVNTNDQKKSSSENFALCFVVWTNEKFVSA